MIQPQALIHKQNLLHNLQLLTHQALKRNPPAALCVSVKANAYGHGIEQVVPVLLEAGVQWIGVARMAEAERVRRIAPEARILMYTPPEIDQVERGIRLDLDFMVPSLQWMDRLSQGAQETGVIPRVHLKVDTGMGRLGFDPETMDHWIESVLKLRDLGTVDLVGLATHMARADGETREDDQWTRTQIASFTRVIDKFSSHGLHPELIHGENSAELLNETRPKGPWTLARPGIAVYGYPTTLWNRFSGLKEVMELRCGVSQVKRVPAGTGISYGHSYVSTGPSTIATTSVGYGDGLRRILSNKIQFSFNGQALDQVGTICMDQSMVAIPDHLDVSADSELTVFGPAPAIENAETLAEKAGTISYEILTGIGQRVIRRLVD